MNAKFDYVYLRTEQGLVTTGPYRPQKGDVATLVMTVSPPRGGEDVPYNGVKGAFPNVVESLGVIVFLEYQPEDGWVLLKDNTGIADEEKPLAILALNENFSEEFDSRLTEHAQAIFSKVLAAKQERAAQEQAAADTTEPMEDPPF